MYNYANIISTTINKNIIEIELLETFKNASEHVLSILIAG